MKNYIQRMGSNPICNLHRVVAKNLADEKYCCKFPATTIRSKVESFIKTSILPDTRIKGQCGSFSAAGQNKQLSKILFPFK